MTIGERIKALRKEKGITQKELADRLGVSASMVGQYETGVRKPKYETIQKIANSLGITTAEFADMSPISPSLSSMLVLLEEVDNSIRAKQKGPNESIPLSDNERQKLKKAAELYKLIPGELSQSEYFNYLMTITLNGFFDKLNFQGKRKALEMLQELTEDSDYTSE